MATTEQYRAPHVAIDAGVAMCPHDQPDALGPAGLHMCPTCRTDLAEVTARLEAIRPPGFDHQAAAAGELVRTTPAPAPAPSSSRSDLE